MKRLLTLLLAATMITSMLAGCGSKEEKPETPSETPSETPAGDASADVKLSGKVLKWNIGADPKTLDPNLISATDGAHVCNNMFEGLYRDMNGELVPAMAESHEEVANEDGTVTYTFKLRDAKWSDGQPVTADNFVFSWRRAVTPKTASEYGYILDPIVNAAEILAGDKDPSELGVKAIDEKTLEVTLKQPTAYFIDLTAFQTFMPIREDIVGDKVDGLWASNPATAVSNGPFKLTEYVMGSHLVLSKNENYWNADSIKLDNILGRMIVDGNTTLTSFRAGETDISEKPPVSEIPQLLAEGDLDILPYIGTYFMVINADSDIEALQDVKVRKALSMAIDRTAITENVTRGGQVPATGFVPYGFPDNNGKDFREVAGNYYLAPTAQIEEAKALLAEAGYPDGQGLPELEILYNAGDNHKAIAEALQEMWKQNLGVNVKLSSQEWAVFQDTRKNLQYTAIARHGWIGDYKDPQTFLDMFISGNPQSGNGYNSAEFDKAIKTAMASTGATRYDNFYKAEEALINDAYIIPIYFYTNPVLVNHERIQGWELSSLGKFWFGNCDILG